MATTTAEKPAKSGQTTEPAAKEAEKQPFAIMLEALNRGKLLAQLSEAAKSLALNVTDKEAKGKLILELTYSPLPNTDGSQVMIKAEIKTKMPQEQAHNNMFFLSPDGHVTRHDPNQGDLFED